MRILFDQATPLPLRAHLDRHEVRTASQQGWATLKNGDLLTAAEANGFEVLLTTDKNLRYQQNLEGRKIAVVVLGRQQWPQVRPHATALLKRSMPPCWVATLRSIYHLSESAPTLNPSKNSETAPDSIRYSAPCA
jgi:hypothetical protein